MLRSFWRLLPRDGNGPASLEYRLLLAILVIGATAILVRLCLATCEFSSHTLQALPGG